MANLHPKGKRGFARQSDAWYPLDNAALLMASNASWASPQVFRLEARMDAPVRVRELQDALEAIAPRFPAFLVELKRGVFWYYLEPTGVKPRVQADVRYPCDRITRKKDGPFLFRVRAGGDTIACEFCHALADGYGSILFARALIAEYALRCGAPWDGKGLPRPGEEPDPEESRDAYEDLAAGRYPAPDEGRPAFRLPGRRLPLDEYRVIRGKLPFASVSAAAKSRGATITEFMAAVYLQSLLDIAVAVSGPRGPRKPVSLQVPVNLRRFFPTKSIRNFVGVVSVAIDPRLGPYDFESILEIVFHTLRLELSPRNLRRQVCRNVRSERNPLMRVIPLFAKDWLLRLVCRVIGCAPYSGTLSNLGSTELPEAVAAHVRRFEFVTTRYPMYRTHATLSSWGGELTVNFGSVIRERELERRFFANLAALGLVARVESNDPPPGPPPPISRAGAIASGRSGGNPSRP